ncbi:hypothetical protein Purlil1_11576 [Purpureocillium lilacinum]|uniref:Uncharacterized protein n=1 Tax=Purpureocillium lilacinum TaxID=33203 RepID=A0ABR0BJ55_PURLI|nr:hypothetical protein Purlil1_11576 [Purpureocillium lilacinum]
MRFDGRKASASWKRSRPSIPDASAGGAEGWHGRATQTHSSTSLDDFFKKKNQNPVQGGQLGVRSLDGATWEAPSGTSSCTRGPPAASAHEMLRRHGGPWGAFSGQPSPPKGGARGWPVMAATSSSPHPVLARRLQFSAWWLAASSAARVGPSGQPTEKGLQEIWPPERKPRLSSSALSRPCARIPPAAIGARAGSLAPLRLPSSHGGSPPLFAVGIMHHRPRQAA